MGGAGGQLGGVRALGSRPMICLVCAVFVVVALVLLVLHGLRSGEDVV